MDQEFADFCELASSGCLEDVQQFLQQRDYRKFVDRTNSLGQTALHLACMNNGKNPKVVAYLSEFGFDLSKADRDECCPLFYAARNLNTDIFEELFRKDNLKIKKALLQNKNGNNLLHYCFGGGEPGISVKRSEEDGDAMCKVVSLVADFLSEEDLCELLNQAGREYYNKTDDETDSLLYLALKTGCLHLVPLLCSHGAKRLDRIPNNMLSPPRISMLSWYLMNTDPSSVDFQQCLSMKTPDDKWAMPQEQVGEALVNCATLKFPIYQTCFDIQFTKYEYKNNGRQNRKIHCAELLLMGWDGRMGPMAAKYKTRALEKALDEEFKFDKMIALLVQQEATIPNPFCKSGGLLHWYIANRLLHGDFEKGTLSNFIQVYNLDVNKKDEKGQTPLHFITQIVPDVSSVSPLATNLQIVIKKNEQPSVRLQMAKELLEHNPSIETVDEAGYTPLMRAVETDLHDLAALLIEKGANPYHNSSGLDAFILAKRHPEKADFYRSILTQDIRKRELNDTLLSRGRQVLRQVLLMLDKDNVSEQTIRDCEIIDSAYKVLDYLFGKIRLENEVLFSFKGHLSFLLGAHIGKVLEKLHNKSILNEVQKNEIDHAIDPCTKLLESLPKVHPNGLNAFLRILEEDLSGEVLAKAIRDACESH